MTFSIVKLTEHTGAEVRGIDFAAPVSLEIRTWLDRAFVDHGVLVIRGQSLSPHQMLDVVRLFGDVFPQHNTRFALPDCPEIHFISNQDKFPDGSRYIPGEGWHTDHSNDARPPKATMLHAVTLPRPITLAPQCARRASRTISPRGAISSSVVQWRRA